MIHRVTTCGTTSDNEWQRMTTSENESANSPLSWIREEPTTKHPKKNFLNLDEDL